MNLRNNLASPSCIENSIWCLLKLYSWKLTIESNWNTDSKNWGCRFRWRFNWSHRKFWLHIRYAQSYFIHLVENKKKKFPKRWCVDGINFRRWANAFRCIQYSWNGRKLHVWTRYYLISWFISRSQKYNFELNFCFKCELWNWNIDTKNRVWVDLDGEFWQNVRCARSSFIQFTFGAEIEFREMNQLFKCNISFKL